MGGEMDGVHVLVDGGDGGVMMGDEGMNNCYITYAVITGDICFTHAGMHACTCRARVADTAFIKAAVQ